MKQILIYFTCFLIMSCQYAKDNSEKGKFNNSYSTKSSQKESQLDTLLNTGGYLILGDKLAKVKVVNENEVQNFPTFNKLIEYRNEVIIGKNIEYANVRIFKKYQPKTSFKDYLVDVYQGKLAEPDFSTAPDAKHFITQIKKECANGINFAGHYTLVIWGCGSTCQSGVIVDRKTGEIYNVYHASLGSEFRKDSKMIIKNVGAIDTMTNLIEVCAYCEVNHIIWTGKEFEEVE